MYLLKRSAGRFLRAWRYYIWVMVELAAGVSIVACEDSVAIAVQDRLACYERQFLEGTVSVECSSLSSGYEDIVEPQISYEDYQIFLREFPEDTDLYYVHYGRVYLDLNGVPVLGMSENEFEHLAGYPMEGAVWIGGKLLRRMRENPEAIGWQDCYVQGESLYLYGTPFPCQVLREETAVPSIIQFDTGVNNDIQMEDCIFLPVECLPLIQEPIFYRSTLEVGGEGYLQKAIRMAEYLAENHEQYHYKVVDRRQAYIKNSWDLSSTISLLGWIGKFALLLAATGIIGIMLIHMDERKKDFAVSMVVGASRRRLMAETAIEIFSLCLWGGAIAIGISKIAAPMLSTSKYLVKLQGHSVWLAAAIAAGIALVVCGVVSACAKIKEPAAALKE